METGQTIAGKYRLNRLLGAGGMASVWSATNVFTERDFAIKFMLPEIARTPESAHRFLLEAKVSARINHPNIIEVIDVGQGDDGSLFLVMELLTGSSLDAAIRRQHPPMTIHEFIGHMRDSATALAAAHRSGVIHRDLKPSNVFLHKDRDGRCVPKILDFGVSKILLEEEKNAGLTIAGTVLGSPHYMSPEQAIGAAGIDGRTDVFAFGGILFEALVGRRAYDAPNFNALIVKIATTEPENIDITAPHLPESLRALVRECLVKDRDGRLASFEPIVERLTAMMPELEHSGLRLPVPASAEPVVSSPPAPQPSSVSPQPTSGKHAATLAGLQGAQPFMRGWHPRAFAVACGLVCLLAIAIGLAARFVRGDSLDRKASTASPSAPSEATAEPLSPSPAQSASADGVPVISVDSLPVASRPTKRARLSITASPGWCSISVDGIARGVTPMTASDLSAGIHRVECIPPIGKPQSATLSMTEGASARHAFTLDE